jgi:hypothetical protein
MMLRIGNGAGFLGDNRDAPRRLVEGTQLDYLTLEYLAELTLSILARSRQKNPAAGYAGDFIDVLASLCPALQEQAKLRIVTNAGGMNAISCARAAAKVLVDAGLNETIIGVVTGDDLAPRLAELQAAGCKFENLDTGRPLAELTLPIVSVNAYLGARPIADVLAQQARLVITGRVADASLTVGPAMHEFGWSWSDWQRLAGASVAGHLIECGAQATGGLYRHWEDLDLANVGYPVVELADDGSCVISKPDGTGGSVNRETVIEQLLYEIGDPAHYLTPDVDVDFTTVEVQDLSGDCVAVRGASGRPATDTYKVSLAYHDGYTASGQLLIYGRDCVAKARACGEMILKRVANGGFLLRRTLVEALGAGESVPGLHSAPADLREVMLRVTVDDSRQDAVERFAKEFAPLITSGPPGIAGYASARPTVRPVFAYWPTLVPKSLVTPQVQVRSAKEWVAS